MNKRAKIDLSDATKDKINTALQNINKKKDIKMDLIKELNDLKEERNNLELRTREKTYSIITRVYGLARACKNDNDSWQDFCREEFFRSRKQNQNRISQKRRCVSFLRTSLMAQQRSDKR